MESKSFKTSNPNLYEQLKNYKKIYVNIDGIKYCINLVIDY